MSEHMARPDRAIANIAAHGDPLDPWQRNAIGKTAQIRLPLRDKIDLRRLALILRETANRLEVISSIRASDDFSALLQAKAEIATAQAKASSRARNRS